MQMLATLQKNPQNIMQYMSDPRMMKTFSVMTGIDLSGMPTAGASENNNMDTSDKPSEQQTTQPEQTSEQPKPTATTTDDLMEDEISDDEEMEDDEAKAERERKAQAENEKAAGTAAYTNNI